MNLDNLNLESFAPHVHDQLEVFGEYTNHDPGTFVKMTVEPDAAGDAKLTMHTLAYEVLSVPDRIVSVVCVVSDDGDTELAEDGVAVVGEVCCEVERGRLAQRLLASGDACQVHGDATPDLGIIMDWLDGIANEIDFYSNAVGFGPDDDDNTDDSPDLPDDPGPVVKIEPDEPKTSKATIPPRISMSKVLEASRL